jgi:hypothetical protein
LDFQGEPTAPTCDQEKIPVDLVRTDGEQTAGILGNKSASHEIKAYLRGKGAGAGNGVSAVGGPLDAVLDALFGGSGGVHGTGKSTTNTHSTTTINVTTTAGNAVGGAFVLDSDSSAASRFEIREIATVNTDASYVLDRALQGTPANNVVLYGCTSWAIDADDPDHPHLGFKLEGDSWRRDLTGCGVKAKLSIPSSGLVSVDVSVMASDWSDTAEENPTYSAPSSAQPLKQNSILWIGSDKYEMIEGSVDFGLSPAPHVATEATNGLAGYVYKYDGATFSAKVYHSDTLLATLQSASTVDIGIQIGDPTGADRPGNTAYIRIPAFQCDGKPKIESMNGVDVISFSGKACRPSVGGSVRLHLAASAS